MLYYTLFPIALIVNTNWTIAAPRWPVRQLQYVVYLYNFLIVNLYDYKLSCMFDVWLM